MPEAQEIQIAFQECKRLFDNLVNASDRMQSYICTAEIATFLESESMPVWSAFGITSWLTGYSVFSQALSSGYRDVSKFPEQKRLIVSSIASLWAGLFKKYPKMASVNFQTCVNKLWHKGNELEDWWLNWLLTMLKNSLGRNI